VKRKDSAEKRDFMAPESERAKLAAEEIWPRGAFESEEQFTTRAERIAAIISRHYQPMVAELGELRKRGIVGEVYGFDYEETPGCPGTGNEPTLTCSEVVERLPECEEKLRGDKCIRFAGHPDKHQDRYGMQWAPHVRPVDIREILRSIFELTARPENRASWVKGTLQERMDKIRELCIKAERKSDSWRERRVQELEELVGKLRCENEWMRSLKPEELSYRNGIIDGFQQAHEPARCGHARGNWKDPKYGTPEYKGDERCEVCELVKALRKRKPEAELKHVLRAANERCNRAKCNHKRLHHVNGICRAGKPTRGRKSKCSCPAFEKSELALAKSDERGEQIRKGAKHE
jgi:hypothetical protein